MTVRKLQLPPLKLSVAFPTIRILRALERSASTIDLCDILGYFIAGLHA